MYYNCFGSGDLEERKRQMARKVREERRRERVISLQEQALLGRGPGLRLSIHSEQHFPVYQPEDYNHFPQPSQQPPDEDDCPTTSSSVSDHSSSLSFAKVHILFSSISVLSGYHYIHKIGYLLISILDNQMAWRDD